MEMQAREAEVGVIEYHCIHYNICGDFGEFLELPACGHILKAAVPLASTNKRWLFLCWLVGLTVCSCASAYALASSVVLALVSISWSTVQLPLLL